MAKEADRPVEDVEDEIEGGEEEDHPLVDDAGSLLWVLLLLRLVVLVLRKPDQTQLEQVGNDVRKRWR